MTLSPRPSRRAWRLALAALGLAAAALWAPPARAQDPTPAGDAAPAASATPAATPAACVDCHLDVAAHWDLSAHANAFTDPAFQQRWTEQGQPAECLTCHPGGAEAGGGMQCEDCHIAPETEHPPAQVGVKSSAADCGACHPPSYAEWRLTGHAVEGIACDACHEPHGQGLRAADAETLCMDCHDEDAAAHRDNLHRDKGVTCVDCHALALPPAAPSADGLKPTGHGFTIRAETCVACHTDSVQAGLALPGYENGPVVATAAPSADGTPAPGASAAPATPPAAAAAAGAAPGAPDAPSMSPSGLLAAGGVAGLALGGGAAWVAWTLARRRRPAAGIGVSDAGLTG
jgi:predicted CXXCH cytochrome family protein